MNPKDVIGEIRNLIEEEDSDIANLLTASREDLVAAVRLLLHEQDSREAEIRRQAGNILRRTPICNTYVAAILEALDSTSEEIRRAKLAGLIRQIINKIPNQTLFGSPERTREVLHLTLAPATDAQLEALASPATSLTADLGVGMLRAFDGDGRVVCALQIKEKP